MTIPQPDERREIAGRQPRHSCRGVRREGELDQQADERDTTARKKPRQRRTKHDAQPAEVRKHGKRNDRAGPRAKRWMDARRDTEQQGTRAIPARAEKCDRQHARRKAYDAVRVLGAQQKERIDGAVLGGARKEDERCGADGEKDVPAKCVDEQCKRLKRQHPLNAADDEGKRDLVDARAQCERQNLVQRRPQPRVIDVKNVVGRICDEPCDDLRRFHRDLPVGKPEHPDAKTQNAAQQQNPESAVHSGKYVADRIDSVRPIDSRLHLAAHVQEAIMRNTSLVLSLGALSAVVGALIVSPVSSDVSAANQAAPALNCDLTQYKASTGLTTALDGSVLTVSWNGQGASQLRARFAIDGGTPTIRDLSVRRGGGEWAMLGQNLTPEYQVTTGRRRMSNDQANAFASLGIDVTPELLEKHKWYAFWDAPLSVPGYYPAPAGGRRARWRWSRASSGPDAGDGTGRNHCRAGRGAPVGIARQAWFQPESQPARVHWRPRYPVCRGRRKKFAAASPRSRPRRARSRATAPAWR